jgi:hypothetical protein
MTPKPLNAAARYLLVAAGTVAAGLGMIGVFVPGLPTTPFVLAAALCYVRSSERMYGWLVSHRRLGPHLKTFVETRSLPLGTKLIGLAMGWTFIGGAALFVAESLFLKIFLLSLGVAKTVAILMIKTTSTRL